MNAQPLIHVQCACILHSRPMDRCQDSCAYTAEERDEKPSGLEPGPIVCSPVYACSRALDWAWAGARSSTCTRAGSLVPVLVRLHGPRLDQWSGPRPGHQRFSFFSFLFRLNFFYRLFTTFLTYSGYFWAELGH